MNIIFKVLISFTGVIFFSVYAFAGSRVPFRFKEETSFLDAKSNGFIGLTKTSNFIGILVRLDKPKGDRQMLDIYRFGKTNKTSVSVKACTELAAKVFGPLDKIVIKKDSQTEFKTRFGKEFCEIVMKDSNKEALFQEKRFYGFVFEGQIYAAVANLNSNLDEEDTSEFHAFLAEIRPNKDQ